MLSNFEEARIYIDENDIKMIDFRMIEEPGGLRSTGLQRVRHDLATKQL